jgi:hypothetical protein
MRDAPERRVVSLGRHAVMRGASVALSHCTREDAMTTVATSTAELRLPDEAFAIDDAQLAAVAFLARYHGRTLDAYRHDLRGFLQWASDNNLAVLAATRPHTSRAARRSLPGSRPPPRGWAAVGIDREDGRQVPRLTGTLIWVCRVPLSIEPVAVFGARTRTGPSPRHGALLPPRGARGTRRGGRPPGRTPASVRRASSVRRSESHGA